MPSIRKRLSFGSSTSHKGARNHRAGQSSKQVSYEVLEPRQLLATIAWSSGDITGDSVVSTNGTSVFAISGSASFGETRVNGVNFINSPRANAGGIAQEQSPGNESLTTTIQNDNSTAFLDGGLGAVGDIIRGGWWGADIGNTATVTLTGLTVGDFYEVQIFANDARAGRDQGYITSLGNGEGGAGIDLELSNQPNAGAAGDFGTGTFTADSTTQTIELAGFLNGSNNSGRLQVNAIQLRNVEPVELLPGAVPLISEFLASNSGFVDDDNGNSTDFIELFNAGEDPINLVGYSLTDDATDPTRYVFPDTILGGGQYLVVFAGDDTDPTSGSDLFTGFGLSSGGEYLGFFDSAGNVVSEFGENGTDFPAQFTNVSYGLENDGTFSAVSFFETPTPGSANANAVDGVIDALPTVSVERGFHEQAFTTNVVSQTPGATLIYTTDGTQPSLTNGIQVQPANSNALAQVSIFVNSTTTLRAGSFTQTSLTQAFSTHSYVFLDDVITSDVLDQNVTNQYTNDVLRDALLDLPTVSFNFDNAITSRDDPEQRTSFELLNPDGSEGIQLDAGISAFGGGFTDFEKENFRLNFGNEFGTPELVYPLFEGFDNALTPAVDRFRQLEFRAGSHDRSNRGFGLSNRFVDETLLDAGYNVPHGRFVHLYINGEYWGQYHVRERWNDDFLASYYGGDSDDYEAINGNINNGNSTPNGWDPGTPFDGTGEAWDNINSIVNDNSLSSSERFELLRETVDLDQYIDFMLVWIAGQSENEYRAGGSSDGSVPFTFYLNDADGWLRDPLDGSGGQGGDKTGNAGPANILGRLVSEADPEFLTYYADRIQGMFGEGGPLSVANSTARLQGLIDQVSQSVILEEARWGSSNEPFGGSLTVQQFQERSQDALDRVLPNIVERGNNIIERFRDRGVFPSFDAPSFSIDGQLQNGGEIESGDFLSIDATELILFTTDGTDPRLEGGGINPTATAFDPSVSSATVFDFGSVWNFLDDGSNQGTAWRSATFDDSSWASGPAELGFGDSPATEISFGGDPNDVIATTYFRKTFEVTESFDTATFDLFFDDAAIVYLNGNEIGRTNNLPATVDYLTFATRSVGDGESQSFNNISNFLVQGTNTLAVEIHQRSAGSTDLSFDGRLGITSQTGVTDGLTLLETTNVIARAFSNGEFSAVSNATFVVPAAIAAPQSDLRITEINFNPVESSPLADDGGDFEFIEIYNSSPTGTIDLAGAQFTDGVGFVFGNFQLAPGERVVIVENEAAFRSRYGDSATVLGEWSGGLSNSGENLELVDSNLDEIVSVNYGDGDPWYDAADGLGFSLVLVDPDNTPQNELGKYYSWRASTELGGTPGTASAEPLGVVINEILANSDSGQSDSIELFNTTSSAIDVSGWFLSDSADNFLQFEIPAGTVIPAGGFLVFDESDFNPNPLNPGPNDFALSASSGDEVFLSQASGGVFVGLQDFVDFGATFDGESLGRLPNGTGRLTRLSSNTFGSANSAAAVSPLVISEVNYHPADPSAAALAIDPTILEGDLEFIEITNTSGGVIDLTDTRIRGEVDFDFGAGTSLASGESVAVVSFDPSDPLNANRLAAFRAHYGISASANLVGGFAGGLSNSSGRISLQQPDTPDLLLTPRVVVDEVVYDDLAPFADADGNGLSLNRNSALANGNFASSWDANSPTPGVSDLVVAAAPQVTNTVRDEGGVLARPDLLSTYSVTFDQDVNVSAGDLQVVNDTFGFVENISGVGFSYNATTRTATWNFSSLPDLDASFYSFELSSSITAAVSGAGLDGDADGIVGGSFAEEVYVAIPGDANLDGDVEFNEIDIFFGTNTGDGATVFSNLNSPGTFTWAQGDFNADGDVDETEQNIFTGVQSGDLAIFFENLGRNVRPGVFQPVTSQLVASVVSQPVVSVTQPVVSLAQPVVTVAPVVSPVSAAVPVRSSFIGPIAPTPVASAPATASVEVAPVASTVLPSIAPASESALSGAQANFGVLNLDSSQLASSSVANTQTVVSEDSPLELQGAHELRDGIFSDDLGDVEFDIELDVEETDAISEREDLFAV